MENVIAEEVAAELAAAVQVYEATPVDPLDFFRYMYAELTPELRAQFAELKAYLDSQKAPTVRPHAATV